MEKRSCYASGWLLLSSFNPWIHNLRCGGARHLGLGGVEFSFMKQIMSQMIEKTIKRLMEARCASKQLHSGAIRPRHLKWTSPRAERWKALLNLTFGDLLWRVLFIALAESSRPDGGGWSKAVFDVRGKTKSALKPNSYLFIYLFFFFFFRRQRSH